MQILWFFQHIKHSFGKKWSSGILIQFLNPPKTTIPLFDYNKLLKN